ncbi:FAD-binding domain [Nitrococcus mobilis]|uniref:FAD-binding domain-containing protein n=1 Tax=Nitrococcus mobilis Nb-231 TaxID=314278 RepID=A4BMI8_9GAMM|nr:FAD-binding domain [Nitrococcus mobilis]EAR23526.1 hypothetical protein NB231_16938 [Nitrococcus mobilis Nb-231]
MNVLISGAGIAGPTLAYWLARYGFRATLVEHAPRLRTGGYVIDFWGTGFEVAERMGLTPQLRHLGYDIQEVRTVDTHGDRRSGFTAEVLRDAMQGRYTSIARGDLAAAVYQSLGARVETLFGERISAIEQDAAGVQVAFEHIPARRYDFVIGADGLHSSVRALVFGAEERFEKFLGYHVAAFETEAYRPRDELVYVGYTRPGKQVARFAMRADRTMFLFVCASDGTENVADDAAARRFLHTQFDAAGWECRAILAAMDRNTELYFDRVSQIRMDTWSNGRVALVGDAAACPSLLAGEGAARAMTAAYVLAGELHAAAGDYALAFARYEEHLRAFLAGKQREAVKFAGAFAPRTALGLFVRNQAMHAFVIPAVARHFLTRSLVDRFTLPEYPEAPAR